MRNTSWYVLSAFGIFMVFRRTGEKIDLDALEAFIQKNVD